MDNYTIETIAEYNEEVLEPINNLLTQLTNSPQRFGVHELTQIIDNPSSQLFIMRADKLIVGMLTLGHYMSPTGRKVWVEDVVIDNKHRSKGLGHVIINHAIEYCKQNYAPCTLMLTSNPTRIAANKLYRSSGFIQKGTNVYRIIFD